MLCALHRLHHSAGQITLRLSITRIILDMDFALCRNVIRMPRDKRQAILNAAERALHGKRKPVLKIESRYLQQIRRAKKRACLHSPFLFVDKALLHLSAAPHAKLRAGRDHADGIIRKRKSRAAGWCDRDFHWPDTSVICCAAACSAVLADCSAAIAFLAAVVASGPRMLST